MVDTEVARIVLRFLFLAAIAMLFEMSGRIIYLTALLRDHEPPALLWWARLKAAGYGLMALYLMLAVWGPGSVPFIGYSGVGAWAGWFIWWAVDANLRRRVRDWRH